MMRTVFRMGDVSMQVWADALLMPGDVSDRYRQQWRRGVEFIREAAQRMPVFYSIGNHETRQTHYRQVLKDIEEAGAVMLVNRWVRFGPVWMGGWYDADIVGVPDPLDAFEKLEGPKVLLCHKPDHYIRYMRGRDIDLVVAGHAHGGQIRIFGQGVYAPGQGLLPRYTRGVVDGRMIISAGASNPSRMPRLWNPPEVLRITLD